MNKILKVSNVSKTFGENGTKIFALNDISFSIEARALTAIVGRSGSGKTTLLNVIGGLERPNQGTVKIGDIDIYQLKDRENAKLRREKIGYIFQFLNLIPELTGYDNICIPSILNHKNPDKEFIEELIVTLGIKDVINKYPAQLSGGEQQRIAVARALSCKPDIILADEPTGSLDKRSGNQLLELLRFSCKEYEQAMLLVTHDLEIAKATNRIISIEDGKLISDIKGEI